MKLAVCPLCGDIVVLRDKKSRACECGNVAGHYVGGPDPCAAVVSGYGVQVLAIDTNHFRRVLTRLVQRELFARDPDLGCDGDYHAPENELDCWFFGPQAREQTKRTECAVPSASLPAPPPRASAEQDRAQFFSALDEDDA